MTTITLHEAIQIFEENLPEIRTACLENASAIISEHSPYKELDVDQDITEEAIVLHIEHLYIQEHAQPLLKTVRRIDSYRMAQANPNIPQDFITDADIERARSCDLDWFIFEANLSTRAPYKATCPFHADRDPSLTLMKSKTTGYYYLKCFPCGIYLDSIGFIMKRDNVNFIEAVRYIAK